MIKIWALNIFKGLQIKDYQKISDQLIESVGWYKKCCGNSLHFPNITNHIVCNWFVYVILTSFQWISHIGITSLFYYQHSGISSPYVWLTHIWQTTWENNFSYSNRIKSNRNTAELVFTFKVLAEKVITLIGYFCLNSFVWYEKKTFDTIRRYLLIEDLKEALNNDEIHLVALLLENVELCVKLENLLGSALKTNIGSPQGDGAYALFFITYLAKSLKNP